MYISDLATYAMHPAHLYHIPELNATIFKRLKARWGDVYAYSAYWRDWSRIVDVRREKTGETVYVVCDQAGCVREHSTRVCLWLCAPQLNVDPVSIYNEWATLAGAEPLSCW